LIWFTYALRSGSVLAFHTVLRTNVMFFFGVYAEILYGPSAYMWL
jgi:hypothetical protein